MYIDRPVIISVITLINVIILTVLINSLNNPRARPRRTPRRKNKYLKDIIFFLRGSIDKYLFRSSCRNGNNKGGGGFFN